MEQRFFSAWHKDAATWKRSSSGGAFTAISDAFFDAHGENAVIYGCVLNEKLEAVHIRAVSKEERNRMCGSKYIGSNLSGVFTSVKDDLLANKKVLFSGTPCQTAGLKAFLNAGGTLNTGDCNASSLLTVEVICHGVGSVRFFNDYKSNMEKRYKSKAVSCRFRAKSRPEKRQDMELTFENGKKYNASSTKYDWFYSVFLKDLVLRPSCYVCPYSKKERHSDISIADHWSVEASKHAKAASLVIANTENGLELAKRSFAYMEYCEIQYEDVHQPHMKAPAKKPSSHDELWKIYKNDGYLALQKAVGNNTPSGILKSHLANVANALHLKEALLSFKHCVKHLKNKVRGKC